MPYNERPIKAFWAAYRNIGGGPKKTDINDIDTLAHYLTLEELASDPPIQVQEDTLSGYLIPVINPHETGGIAQGNLGEKHYLDLQVLPVNYATFYSFFLSRSKNAGGTWSNGDCDKLKMAVPVPSYIMGFVKNPLVMTYYAVKATTRFVGLFFPFAKFLPNGIELQAYAAAKPFGGRIGPWHFRPDMTTRPRNAQKVIVRGAQKSTPYLVRLAGISNTYEGGDPIPSDDGFYADKNNLGGIPSQSGDDPSYAIPNMIYDFIDGVAELNVLSVGTSYLSLTPAVGAGSGNPPRAKAEEGPVGLYDWDQYKYFKDSTLRNIPQVLGGDAISEGIRRSQRPTKYEALNWMIPLRTRGNMESPTTAIPLPDDDTQSMFYAPLFGDGTLYSSADAVVNEITEYMRLNEKNLEKFLEALKETAVKIMKEAKATAAASPTTAGADHFKLAAGKIYPLTATGDPKNGTMQNGDSVFDCTQGEQNNEISVAGFFYHSLKASEAPGCGTPPITPIIASLRKVIQDIGSDAMKKEYLIADYVPPGGQTQDPRPNPLTFSTAWSPGQAHGSTTAAPGESQFQSPLGGAIAGSSKRNYYSTKFIHTDKLFLDGANPYGYPNLFREDKEAAATFRPSDIDTTWRGLTNPLPRESLEDWGEVFH